MLPMVIWETFTYTQAIHFFEIAQQEEGRMYEFQATLHDKELKQPVSPQHESEYEEMKKNNPLRSNK